MSVVAPELTQAEIERVLDKLEFPVNDNIEARMMLSFRAVIQADREHRYLHHLKSAQTTTLTETTC